MLKRILSILVLAGLSVCVLPAQKSPFEVDPTKQVQVKAANDLPTPNDLKAVAAKLKALQVKYDAHGLNPFAFMRKSGLVFENKEQVFDFMGLLSMLANPDLSDGDYMVIASAVFNSPHLMKLLDVK